MPTLTLATRKSPLALAQTGMVAAVLRSSLGVETAELRIVTTGDRQTEWSLEKKGGKGLFTSELEAALRRGEADVAVHSTKDLPGEMAPGLAIAGYLPRADARDVLVLREGVAAPRLLATGSPRRRLQVQRLFPNVAFTEIRGNVDTRLRKIAEQQLADGTILAAAGLHRLGISAWPGLTFTSLGFAAVVPAVGQGAIAIQCRASEAAGLAGCFDAATMAEVSVERAFQSTLGGGCQTAFAAHVAEGQLHLFHEACGIRQATLTPADFAAPTATADRLLRAWGLRS